MTDTGVRFSAWAATAPRLYTGSSDGVVKLWDATRASDDALVQDIVALDSGVMSGSFSHDHTSLLLGEVNGSVTVLEVGRAGTRKKDVEHFEYVPAPKSQLEAAVSEEPDSGVAAARQMLLAGEMHVVPMGGFPVRQAVQGPGYCGPFDKAPDAPELRRQAHAFQQSMASQTAALVPQCAIPGCKDAGARVTSEEAGDSGRSADRIPDALRRAWAPAPARSQAMVPGKCPCASCGRPARPRAVSDSASAAAAAAAADDDDAPAYCERCAFSCFRCGALNRIAPDSAALCCVVCDRAWEIGALGYRLISDAAGARPPAGESPVGELPAGELPALGHGARRSSGFNEVGLGGAAGGTSGDEDKSFDAEADALVDFYFGLTEDA